MPGFYCSPGGRSKALLCIAHVNSLITSVKKELSVRSSTTAVPDIDLYQILMNQHKVQVFRDVVKMIKEPRVIQAQNLYIPRKSVLLDCLEAGEAAYMDRRNSYEILNG